MRLSFTKEIMAVGNFYFLTDDYFVDFPDPYIMKNKEMLNGQLHDRPCYFVFTDSNGLYWLIPFSSKIAKYQNIYSNKIKKYGHCDTIAFYNVLGHAKAFLIQNMCPATGKYIKNIYIDSANNIPVRLNGKDENDIIAKANKVLALQRKGIKLIFPDVLGIEKILLNNF